jgi:hypothetical protein
MTIRFAMAVVCLLSGISANALAQGDQAQRHKNALNNVQHEMTACAVYFNIYAACLAHSKYDGKTVDGMQKIASEFIDRGGSLAKEIGLTPDAVASRYKMAEQDEFNLIKNDCVNISSLISRYVKRRQKGWL